MSFVWSALVIGIVGNLHCLGMCGPIALALPIAQKGPSDKLFSIVLYNGGRILTYAVLGLILGSIGEGLSLLGVSQYLSIVFGFLMLFIGVLSLLKLKNPFQSNALLSSYSDLKRAFSKQLKKRNNAAFFTMGLLNGLLPCGLIYVALAGALASGGLQHSVLFMILFGLGTLPAMLALPLFSARIQPLLGLKWNLAIPVLTICFGLLMVLRGSNLGIPYISPKANTEQVNAQFKCH